LIRTIGERQDIVLQSRRALEAFTRYYKEEQGAQRPVSDEHSTIDVGEKDTANRQAVQAEQNTHSGESVSAPGNNTLRSAAFAIYSAGRAVKKLDIAFEDTP
jgi:hypothetical protein